MKLQRRTWANLAAGVLCGAILSGCGDQTTQTPEAGSALPGKGLVAKNNSQAETSRNRHSVTEISLEVVAPQRFQAILKNEDHRGKVILVDYWATW